MVGIRLKYHFEIRDTKTGKLIKRTRKRFCRSFVIGFMKHLSIAMAHDYGVVPDDITLYDTSGALLTLNMSSEYFYIFMSCEAPGADDSHGIVLGTGTTAVTTGDYAVETPIANGSGSSQLNYGASVVGGAVDAGSGCTLTLSRQFGNASGAQISVRELCLVCSTRNSQNAEKYFLLSRDIVTQAIDNGNTATAIIEISTEL